MAGDPCRVSPPGAPSKPKSKPPRYNAMMCCFAPAWLRPQKERVRGGRANGESGIAACLSIEPLSRKPAAASGRRAAVHAHSALAAPAALFSRLRSPPLDCPQTTIPLLNTLQRLESAHTRTRRSTTHNSSGTQQKSSKDGSHDLQAALAAHSQEGDAHPDGESFQLVEGPGGEGLLWKGWCGLAVLACSKHHPARAVFDPKKHEHRSVWTPPARPPSCTSSSSARS